jgi:endonuclease-3
MHLLARYGAQRDDLRLAPLSQLVLAILSARTRDEISSLAFEGLLHRYGSWDVLSEAAAADVERVIHQVTYADRKAEQLPRALRMITERTGALSLDFLVSWSEEDALGWLGELPGVGMRNAATTLNFSKLRKRTLSVGTQHLRVGERLGFLKPVTTSAQGYERYMRLVPNAWDSDDLYELHWLIKLHGQQRCHHVLPACAGCELASLCRYRNARRGAGARTLSEHRQT